MGLADSSADFLRRLALTYPEAAASVGLSVEMLRREVLNHRLVASYVGTKPIFMIDELERWLRALPPETA